MGSRTDTTWLCNSWASSLIQGTFASERLQLAHPWCAGGANGDVRVWDKGSRELVSHLVQHKVTPLRLPSTPPLLPKHKRTCVWPRHVLAWRQPQDIVCDVKVYNDDSHIISGSRDGTFVIWDVFGESRISSHYCPTGGFTGLELAPDQVEANCSAFMAYLSPATLPIPSPSLSPAHPSSEDVDSSGGLAGPSGHGGARLQAPVLGCPPPNPSPGHRQVPPRCVHSPGYQSELRSRGHWSSRLGRPLPCLVKGALPGGPVPPCQPQPNNVANSCQELEQDLSNEVGDRQSWAGGADRQCSAWGEGNEGGQGSAWE